MKQFDLGGRTAIVTGSSSRKADACETVVAAIKKDGGSAISVSCNVGHKDQLAALVAETRQTFGAIDILVCNAAVNPYFGPLAEIPDDAFDRIMDSNVRSNLWLCNMVIPEMAQRKDGAVIIVSSIGGLRGSAMLGAYGISKAADMQLARSLAVEWGKHNIRVNAIAPGLVKTDFARALWENKELL